MKARRFMNRVVPQAHGKLLSNVPLVSGLVFRRIHLGTTPQGLLRTNRAPRKPDSGNLVPDRTPAAQTAAEARIP